MWQQISSNKRKSFIFITLMAILLFAIGYFYGEFFAHGSGLFGLTIAFIVWIIMCLTSYFNGSNIFLAMADAKKITHDDYPLLFNVVEEMTLAAGLPKVPDIYIIDEEQPNAFATGRNPKHSAIAVTTGLLKMLNRDELQGVVAHEIAHILNRDTLFMLFASITMGAIVYISDIFFRMLIRSSRKNSKNNGIIIVLALILAILAPVFAQMLYFAISRKREYLADACAAQFTRYPLGLANALTKISRAHIPIINSSKAMASMYIVNPFSIREKDKEQPNGLVILFRKVQDFCNGVYSTHPKTEDRVTILAQMGHADVGAYNEAFKKVNHSSIINNSTIKDSSVLGIVIPQNIIQNQISDTLITDTKIEEMNNIQKVKNIVHSVNKDIIINCECETILKIPQSFINETIKCPFCNKEYKIS